MIAHVLAWLTALPAWLFLLAAFILPALESAAFVGFVFPGETTLILGGVLAAQGGAPWYAVAAAGVLGAIAGDSIGYAVGRRFGPALLRRAGGRQLSSDRIDRIAAAVARRGPFAVFLGRFTAVLRVLVPGIAGISGMRYRSFLLWNVAGAIVWAPAAVLLGYLGGTGITRVQHLASGAGLALVAALGLAVVALHLRRRLPTRLRTRPSSSATPPIQEATVPDHAPDPMTAQISDRLPLRGPAPRTVVVVPTYDEAANITELLDRLAGCAPWADVLVVDDASPDGTAGLVRARPDHGTRCRVLDRPGKQGLGAAYRAGFAWALEHDYAVVVQMDADLSHPPERVPALVGALDAAQVAVGSRYVAGGGVADWPASRRFISWAGNVYVRGVLNLGVRDATAGFKAFRREALIRAGVLSSDSDGYCFQIENTWRAVRRGLRVVEVPITFRDRTAGTSKMSGRIVAEAVCRVLAWRLCDLRARRLRKALA